MDSLEGKWSTVLCEFCYGINILCPNKEVMQHLTKGKHKFLSKVNVTNMNPNKTNMFLVKKRKNKLWLPNSYVVSKLMDALPRSESSWVSVARQAFWQGQTPSVVAGQPSSKVSPEGQWKSLVFNWTHRARFALHYQCNSRSRFRNF